MFCLINDAIFILDDLVLLVFDTGIFFAELGPLWLLSKLAVLIALNMTKALQTKCKTCFGGPRLVLLGFWEKSVSSADPPPPPFLTPVWQKSKLLWTIFLHPFLINNLVWNEWFLEFYPNVSERNFLPSGSSPSFSLSHRKIFLTATSCNTLLHRRTKSSIWEQVDKGRVQKTQSRKMSVRGHSYIT